MSEEYLSMIMVPVLLVLVLGYYSVRLLVFRDVKCIRGKDAKKPKDEKAYAAEAGKLMAFLAFASLVMAVIMYWNTMAALAEIGVCIVVFGILWKRMHEKYGD